MDDLLINYWAVLVSGVSAFVLGWVWYSPALFGKAWIAGMGWSEKQMQENKGGGMLKPFSLTFLGSVIMAYVLAYVLAYTGTASLYEAMQVAAWLWLGFVVTTTSSSYLFERKPFSFYFINVSYHFVSLLVASAILFYWV